MEIDLNVLCLLMLHGIAGEVHSIDVITVDQGGTTRGVLELKE
jgi:hypothetical protein